MPTSTQAFAGFDPVADEREVSHPGPGDPRLGGALGDSSTRFRGSCAERAGSFCLLPETCRSFRLARWLPLDRRRRHPKGKRVVALVGHLFRRQKFCLCLWRRNSFARHLRPRRCRMPEPAYPPFRRGVRDTTSFRERPRPVPSADRK